MTPFLDYLLKLSASLALVGLFYQLVLRRLTFYNWNRWYLLAYSALAFTIPFINLNQVLPPEKLSVIPALVETRFIASDGEKESAKVPEINSKKPPVFENRTLSISPKSTPVSPFTPEQIATTLLLSGIAFMLLRLAFHLIAFSRIKNRARLVSDGDGVKVYHAAREIVPFSFGNAIFYNPALHQTSDLKEIIAHELVHVRQRHTLDILFAEVLCILNWYNPFAWLIRHAIRQNLEFIADREVLENGTDARAYQFLLLKVAGVPEFRLANQFNFSSLKQRIIMMNRLKTTQVHLLRFLFIMPLLLVLLIACRTEIENEAAENQIVVPLDRRQVDFEYLAGLLIDAETGNPLTNLALEKTVSRIERAGSRTHREPVETLGTITTDENGFYFWKIDVRNQAEEGRAYKLEPKDKRYEHLNIEVLHGGNWFSSSNMRYSIHFVSEGQHMRPHEIYSVLRRDFNSPGNEATEAGEVKQLLLEKLPRFAAQHRLVYDFRKQYWKPEKIITKFRNGYFSEDRYLLGYEGVLEFYLDGKKVDHEAINREFRGYLIEPAKREYDESGMRLGVNNKLFYLTFPVYRKPPPRTLLTDRNVEWVDPKSIDLAVLEREPYMLDGFRQTYGTSSNIKPKKEDIRRVAIFKGKLARYYDRKLDKLWWIETRPAEEVMERPDFVAR